MSDTTETTEEAARAAREISTIQFPYVDLEEAIRIVRAMHERAGGAPMDRDQVSAAINSAGGNLANKLSAAKQFGLIDNPQGKWSLTPLGYEIVDGAREHSAKAEAFLNVELYKRTYDEFRGKPLPGKAGLEHRFTTFGVAAKQKEKARQTFERSARTAGFFPTPAEDRLVAPIIGATVPMTQASPASESSLHPGFTEMVVSRAQPAPELDGVITALIGKLPKAGTTFSAKDRVKWLTMMEMALEMAYGSETTPD